MNTERFELTNEEIKIAQEDYIKRTWSEVKVNLDYPLRGWRRDECLLKAQVSKVLSMLEPVELEALGDEEMKEAICSNPIPEDKNLFRPMDVGRCITQATIRKNQAKGQLYKVKE